MKTCFVIRAFAAPFSAAMLAAMLSGCFSLSLTHEIDGVVEEGPLGGRYNIKSVDAPLAEALRKHAPKSIVFTDENSLDALPLNVSVSDAIGEDDTTSVAHFLPGALTLCTLPAVIESKKTHVVRSTSPLGQHEICMKIVGRETVCWTPLGWLPLAFPLDAYDYTACDLLEKWHDEKEQAWSDATTNAVAKAIIATLTKTRYDAYMEKCVNDARRRNNEDEARRQENVLRMAELGWPQETMLRDFAIKEATGLWDIVVEFRAEISMRKKRLLKLKTALVGFGRNPEEDSDFIKCKSEYDAARNALAQILKSVEDAYLAASKNDALYESAEARAKTQKAVDACLMMAIDAKKRILKTNQNTKGDSNE